MASSAIKTPGTGDIGSAMRAYGDAVLDGSVKKNKQQLRDLLTCSGVADEGADAMLSDEVIDLAARYVSGAPRLQTKPSEKASLWTKTIQSLKS